MQQLCSGERSSVRVMSIRQRTSDRGTFGYLLGLRLESTVARAVNPKRRHWGKGGRGRPVQPLPLR